MISFEIEAEFETAPENIFNAWLSSKQHSAMTGGEALTSAAVGDNFTAWNGYISGINLILNSPSYIKQNWRTTEFDSNDKDSVVELFIENKGNGTKLTLKHSMIPNNQSDYKAGWEEHYFSPMRAYFNK